MKYCSRMTKSAILENYFSEITLSHLKPQQGLSEHYQRCALDVTLACKLTSKVMEAYTKIGLETFYR